MALETRYAARRDWPVERLVESLSALLPVRRQHVSRRRITFLDTPDGRVGRAGACLTLISDAAGSRMQWRHGNVRIGCALEGDVRYAWEVPAASVRRRIEPIVEARRLLPLAEAEQDGVQLDVMDDTRKIIARLDIVAGRARAPKPRSSWRPFEPFLTLSSLRGYDDQCAGPIAIIESRPGIERSELPLQGHVLRVIGVSLPQDASSYCVELEPMVRADVGMRQMQRELLRIVSANHAGVVAGLDSEFLHDFRVAVHRGRNLFEQAQGVLPTSDLAHLASELGWLRRVTGPARDVDVLLSWVRASSRQRDAQSHQLLLDALERERAAAQSDLVVQLTGDRYRQLVDRWAALLSGECGVATGEGCGVLPLMAIVSRRAWALYQRLLTGVEHVSDDTPAGELHRIRSDAKNLRYLIDAAASLYDADHLAVVLGALGRLQSALGELNDACAQWDRLRRQAQAWSTPDADFAPLRQAVEALAGLAGRRAAELRKPANQQLLRFGESATCAAFERVFHIKHLIELLQ